MPSEVASAAGTHIFSESHWHRNMKMTRFSSCEEDRKQVYSQSSVTHTEEAEEKETLPSVDFIALKCRSKITLITNNWDFF